MIDPRVQPFLDILLAGVPVPRLPKLVCAWCDRVLRLGALPASHGLCPTCAARLDAEIA